MPDLAILPVDYLLSRLLLHPDAHFIQVKPQRTPSTMARNGTYCRALIQVVFAKTESFCRYRYFD
jgi:hypothetical protein